METEFNRQISKHTFFELIKYFSKLTRRIEVAYCEPLYRMPHNRFIITLLYEQKKVNSAYIKKMFNVHVAKFETLFTESGSVYELGKRKYDKELESCCILIELVD